AATTPRAPPSPPAACKRGTNPTSGTAEPHKGRRLAGAVFAVALAAAALMVSPILTALPALAGLFAGPPPAFPDVRRSFLRNAGQDGILVEGRLINTTADAVSVPAIRISIRDARSREIRSWVVNPVAAELDAGASVGFRSAAASPPGGEN